MIHLFKQSPKSSDSSLSHNTASDQKISTISVDDFEIEEEKEPSRSPTANTLSLTVLLRLLPLGLSALTLLYLFHLSGQINHIRNNHNRVLVQTVDGRSITAEPVDNYVRTPTTVEQTVKLWTDLSFNWVQKLPNGEQDLGKQISGKMFPTRLVQGSTLLTPELQSVWLEVFQQREDYLPVNFLGSDATRIFYPKLQTTPRQPIDPRSGQPIKDRYEVEVYGNWVEYSSDSLKGKLIDRLGLRLDLRPVVKTEPDLSDDADPLQRAAYELRANGLEIYDIQRIPYAR